MKKIELKIQKKIAETTGRMARRCVMVVSLILWSPSFSEARAKIFPRYKDSTAQKIRVLDGSLNFSYMSSDGEIMLECAHSQIRDLPDWTVVCGKGTRIEKKFTVHFVVHEYRRVVAPQISYEFLYWVTDSSGNQQVPNFDSSVNWIHLKDPSPLFGVSLYQGVENDAAGLTLNYSP